MAEVRHLPPGGHSEYSASAAHRWMVCPGSLVTSKDTMRPKGGSQYAAEGTVAHFVAAEAITTRADAGEYVGTQFESDGFTFKVDADMASHIQVYLDSIAEYTASATQLLTEVKVNYAAALGAKPDDAWGTADNVVLRPDRFSVHDLKFGRGDEVDAEDNKQMMLYALGVLDEYGDLLGYDDDTVVTMVIHQPRVRKAPTEWSCTVRDLRAFAEEAKRAMHATKAALWAFVGWKNDGRSAEGWARFEREYLVPGEKQCRYCPAKAGCSAVRNVVAKAVMGATPASPDEFEAVKFEPKKHVAVADVTWLAAALKQAPLIGEWLKAVYAEGDRRLNAGQHVPGFKLVMGKRGDRVWIDAVAAEHMLKHGLKLPDDKLYTRKLVSPTQVEALTTGKAPVVDADQWGSLQELIQRADGKPTVVPESDPRPAHVVTPVADEFDDLTKSIADELG